MGERGEDPEDAFLCPFVIFVSVNCILYQWQCVGRTGHKRFSPRWFEARRKEKKKGKKDYCISSSFVGLVLESPLGGGKRVDSIYFPLRFLVALVACLLLLLPHEQSDPRCLGEVIFFPEKGGGLSRP